MTHTKHSTGTWSVDPGEHRAIGGERIFKVVKDGFGGGLIADVSAWWVDPATAQANAALIAAAPDMLEALRHAYDVLRFIDSCGRTIDPVTLNEISAAIAKARP